MAVVAFGISFQVTKAVGIREAIRSFYPNLNLYLLNLETSKHVVLSPPLFTALLAFFCFPIFSATILQLFYLSPLVLLSACSTTLSFFP